MTVFGSFCTISTHFSPFWTGTLSKMAGNFKILSPWVAVMWTNILANKSLHPQNFEGKSITQSVKTYFVSNIDICLSNCNQNFTHILAILFSCSMEGGVSFLKTHTLKCYRAETKHQYYFLQKKHHYFWKDIWKERQTKNNTKVEMVRKTYFIFPVHSSLPICYQDLAGISLLLISCSV